MKKRIDKGFEVLIIKYNVSSLVGNPLVEVNSFWVSAESDETILPCS